MRKVKVLLTKQMYVDYDEYRNVLAGHVTEWEEISDEDFKFLERNWYSIRSEIVDESSGYDAFLITPDIVPVVDRIISLKAKLDKRRQEEENKKKAAEAKKVAAALKKAAKDAETKRKLFEELKKEFEPEKGDPDHYKFYDDPEGVGHYRG